MKIVSATVIAPASPLAVSPTAKQEPVQAASPTITVETNDSSLELAVGENLLDALLNSGHAVEYQCRSGYCGACRLSATHGQVNYDEYPLAQLNADEILPCCCRVSEPLKLAVGLRDGSDAGQGDLFD